MKDNTFLQQINTMWQQLVAVWPEFLARLLAGEPVLVIATILFLTNVVCTLLLAILPGSSK